MSKTDNNPRLETGMREAYRSGTVSPYLFQRVVATVKSRKRKLRLGFKLAGGFISAAVLVVILTIYNETEVVDSPQGVSTTSNSIQYSVTAIPVYSEVDLNIPGLSSLARVPTLHRFRTPTASLDTPGDFCIYQHTGELSC